MNDILLVVISSGLLSTVFTTIVNYIEKNKNKDDDTKRALMILLGWQVREACKSAIKTKKLTINELKQIEEMYKMYHQMGGNGFVKVLMEKVEKLEIVED